MREEFNNLPPNLLQAFEIKAEHDCERAMGLWDELKTLLLDTKGKLGYKAMADQLGGKIVGVVSIRRVLKNQEGFRMRKDRILPSLDAAAKVRHVVWGESFWIFWKSVACEPIQKVICVLVH